MVAVDPDVHPWAHHLFLVRYDFPILVEFVEVVLRSRQARSVLFQWMELRRRTKVGLSLG